MNKENPCRFEELSTEGLDELLNAELGKEKKDRTTVIEILRILEEREADKPVELSEEVVMAWANYQDTQKRKFTAGRNHSLWITRAAAVFVAISILVVSIPAVAGLGFFETIAQWTADIFKFSGTLAKTEVPEDYVFETDNPDLQKVYDAVCEMGIKYPVVPMWFPEGYRLTQLDSFGNISDLLLAKFTSNTDEILLCVRKMEGTVSSLTKDENVVRVYMKNSNEHYIIQNESEVKAAWVTAGFVVTISSTSTQIPIDTIIDSIYR